jgi:thiamine biosynthesis lipoprotein
LSDSNSALNDSLSHWFELLSCESLARAAAELVSPPETPPQIASSVQSIRDTLLLTISRQAMACEWEVLLNQHQYPLGAEEAMRALDLIEKLEALHTVFRTHSDLIAINRFAATRPVAVAHDTLVMLKLARDIHALTEGAFDITAGSLSQAWGFSRRSGRMPTEGEIAKAREVVGTEFILFDESQSLVELTKPGVTLNPGGIGKGYALDRSAGRLVSSGVLDFMMHGGLSSVVAHPWRWEEQIGTIRLNNQALATSGSGKQFFHYQGQRYSHIIDPRSGWPAQGMMSTTVICPSAAVADALATALFVMGPDKSRDFCQKHPAVAAVLVFTDAKSGATVTEAHNLTEAQWQPLR